MQRLLREPLVFILLVRLHAALASNNPYPTYTVGSGSRDAGRLSAAWDSVFSLESLCLTN